MRVDPSMLLSWLSVIGMCHSNNIMFQVIGDWVATRTLDDVLQAMKEARVPSGPILSAADIYAEQQFRERNMFHVAEPPDGALRAQLMPRAGKQNDQPVLPGSDGANGHACVQVVRR